MCSVGPFVGHNAGCSMCSPTADKHEGFLNMCDARFITTFAYSRCMVARHYHVEHLEACREFYAEIALQKGARWQPAAE